MNTKKTYSHFLKSTFGLTKKEVPFLDQVLNDLVKYQPGLTTSHEHTLHYNPWNHMIVFGTGWSKWKYYTALVHELVHVKQHLKFTDVNFDILKMYNLAGSKWNIRFTMAKEREAYRQERKALDLIPESLRDERYYDFKDKLDAGLDSAIGKTLKIFYKGRYLNYPRYIARETRDTLKEMKLI